MNASDIAEQALEIIHWIKEHHKAPDWILRTEEIFKSVETEYVDITPALRSISAEAKREEAEACAKICESMRPSQREYDHRYWDGCTASAVAIRKRWGK